MIVIFYVIIINILIRFHSLTFFSGFVEWVDGAMPLSKIISEYATTNQMLAKVNQDCINATLAAQVRTNLVVNSDVGIAYRRSSSRLSSTRAIQRLSSAASRECDRIPQTLDRRSSSSISSDSGDECEVGSKKLPKDGKRMSVGFDQQPVTPNSDNLPPGAGMGDAGKEIDSPIHNYLRYHHPSNSFYDLFGIDSSAMHTYVNTVAGSCVLTYILGKFHFLFTQ